MTDMALETPSSRAADRSAPRSAVSAGVGMAVLNSYLMREVSTAECREVFNRNRFEKLKGLNHTQGFIDRASQGQVIDDLVANHALFIDQEQTSEGYGITD